MIVSYCCNRCRAWSRDIKYFKFYKPPVTSIHCVNREECDRRRKKGEIIELSDTKKYKERSSQSGRGHSCSGIEDCDYDK